MASRKRKTAEARRNIGKGVKKFWDKKGNRKRTSLVLGSSALAVGGLALAAKHGKIPSIKGAKEPLTNLTKTVGSQVKSVGSVANDFVEVGTKRAQSATQQAVKTAKRGGAIVKDGTRAIVPTKMNSAALAVRGSTSKALTTVGQKSNAALDSVLQPLSKAAGRTYAAGKATRQAFTEGYQNAKPGEASYELGKKVFEGTKKSVQAFDALIKRAKKKRGK